MLRPPPMIPCSSVLHPAEVRSACKLIHAGVHVRMHRPQSNTMHAALFAVGAIHHNDALCKKNDQSLLACATMLACIQFSCTSSSVLLSLQTST